MADRLYLSLWYPNFRLEALPAALTGVLRQFVLVGGKRVAAATVYPINFTQPPTYQRIYVDTGQGTGIDRPESDPVASATDAAHARAWEESQFGECRAETLVDHEYFEDLVAAWSMVATQREIDSLDGLLTDAASVH